jgi:hypothetical protein
MEIDLENYSRADVERYNRVKHMGKDELALITPIWTTLENKQAMISSSIYYGLEDDKVVIVNIDLPQLVASAEFWELDPQRLITDHANDFRFVRIIERWEKGRPIDPPEIYYRENSDRIYFSDGRHRTIAAFHIGIAQIPIAIDVNQLERVTPLLTAN